MLCRKNQGSHVQKKNDLRWRSAGLGKVQARSKIDVIDSELSAGSQSGQIPLDILCNKLNVTQSMWRTDRARGVGRRVANLPGLDMMNVGKHLAPDWKVIQKRLPQKEGTPSERQKSSNLRRSLSGEGWVGVRGGC